MGKNGRFGKGYGAIVGKDTKSPPGWKGPGFSKKSEPAKSKRAIQDEKTNSSAVSEAALPVELQQLLLNIYRDTFPEALASDTLQALLQEVKKALYERDFTKAFGKEEFLEVYSIRWSPSRTLCYQSILVDLLDHLTEIFPVCRITPPELENGSAGDDASPMGVTCFGGGAAEVVAFGGFLRYLQDTMLRSTGEDSSPEHGLSNPDRPPGIDLCLVDTAQWQGVVRKLYDSFTTPPPLSKYASSSAKEANEALTASTDFNVTFRQDNVLGMSGGELVDVAGGRPMLVTLLFTLNELYTSSIGKTTAFLLNLTAAATSGSLLLVVDSPGSYSEATVGTEAKRYPMHWLLDHTLLETQKSRGSESALKWVKLVSEDSKWFRIPESIRYPIPLENMRYQMHLYRRV
ncbi:hypothetical protein BGZ57DRAFT_773105 [Hyaloscypha finlandica]|nr:hypothetical protein BGZ57DRAFT_773105 [Hyaloscypha finlandica]